VPIITLLTLAVFIDLLNRSHFLREYRASRLPRVGELVLLLVCPLVLLDHQMSALGLHVAWLLLLAVGGFACFIDIEHRLLPDRLILPAIAISLSLIASTQNVLPALYGGLVWSSSFAVLALINPDGLGWGDVKFAALLGLDCGAIDFKHVPIAIFLALMTGGLYSLVLLAKGDRGVHIAFGPFMFLGAVASLMRV
jgi:leader peptidase (prepilin peptidase)/N-methyltransferase